MHGYKAHVATDEGADLVRSLEVATANIRGAAELAAMLPGDLGKVYSDSAFGGSRSASAIRAKVDSLP
jgi:IS5 family transposase